MGTASLPDQSLAGSHDGKSAPQKIKGYRRDIDGLRAIAVTSVVAYHAGLMFFPGGYIGVDIFFVISGFLIGAHVYRDIKRGRFSIASFYQKRAKRILPALFGVLFFCYVAAFFLLDAPELKAFAQNVVATVLSASNIFVWLRVNYFESGASQNPLLMTWSLGVEEQFYLFFPLVMMLFAKISRKKLLIAGLIITLLSLVLSAIGVVKYRNATFYLLPSRAWELSVGVLLAIYENDRPVGTVYCKGRFANWLGLLGMGMLLYPIVSYSDRTSFPGLAAILPVAGAALLLISPSGWVNRFLLSSQPLVFIGLVSYSWYLWHWPLLSFARIVSDRELTIPVAATIALFSLVVAWFSYRFVERPFRNSQTATGPLLRKYAVLCVLVMLPALAAVAGKGLPQRFPQLALIEPRSGLMQNVGSCWVDYGVSSPNVSPNCVPVRDPRPGVALLGDSHAGALADAFHALAQAHNLKLYELMKGSCPPLAGVTRRMLNHPGHDAQCSRFNEESRRIVLEDPSIHTVVLAGNWSAPFTEEPSGARFARSGDTGTVSSADSAANLARGLADAIAEFNAAGKHVILLQDVPIFDFDPVRRLRSDYIPLRGFLARQLRAGGDSTGSAPLQETVTPESTRASAIIAAAPSAEIIDLKQRLCSAERCDFYADGFLLYADPQHLSLAGARRALTPFPIH